jgi:hypothetical protein
MSSAWAEEAEQQAKAMTRDLIEVGKEKGFRVTYQKREARFSLRAGPVTAYFSAHDYTRRDGTMDWLQLRIDILTRVRQGMNQDLSQGASQGEQGPSTPAPH